MSSHSYRYDRIYVGAGIINCLDAANASLEGLRILIIDNSASIGGAWRTISPFGRTLVENAVHYLMPHERGYYFVERVLRIPLSGRAEGKYFALSLFGVNVLLSVKHTVYRVFALLCGASFRDLPFRKKFRALYRVVFCSSVSMSRYPVKGSQGLVERVSDIVESLAFDILFESRITAIRVDEDGCETDISNKTYTSKEVCISHGFIPPEMLTIHGKDYQVKTEIHARPSLHIQCRVDAQQEKRLASVSQVLFAEGHLIKYVHNLTQFTTTADDALTLVVALREGTTKSVEVIDSVVEELRKYRILPDFYSWCAHNTYWQDIFLPLLSTSELERISQSSKGRIRYFLTEEMSYALAHYSSGWNYLKDWMKSRPFVSELKSN
jgi:hypothetical protein